MTKARDLANFVSTGNPLADGTLDVADISDLTATAAELNVLDGITATTAELNILDGVTSSTAELNLLDGAVANTVVNNTAVIYGASGEITANQIDILAQGDLRLQDTTGGQYVALQAPGTVSSSFTLTLPAADGTANQFLKTDGSGNLAFSNTFVDPAITGTILEDVYTISDGAAFEIDPSNGSVQLITLGASRTPKATNFADGEAITLMVDDGTDYTLTWTDATFGGSGVVWKTDGGAAPTLNTSGYTVIVLWKVSSQVYGARVGDA